MAAQFVTIWDPTGTLPVGEVVEGDKVLVAKRKRAMLLPADPHIYYSASPGFAYRPWGTGWQYDNVMSERGCPMMIAVDPEHPWIYFAFQAMPIREGEPLHGQFRLIGDSSAGGLSIGMSQDVRLQPLQCYLTGTKGGVVVAGRCGMSVTTPGIFGMSLHGIGRNVRVVWSAVSIAHEQIEVQESVPV